MNQAAIIAESASSRGFRVLRGFSQISIVIKLGNLI